MFTLCNTRRWLKVFPVPEVSPSHHVRDLRVWLGGEDSAPENLFELVQWFPNVEKISLMGYEGDLSLRRTSLWKLPPSITTLAVDTDAITLVQVWDVIAKLPNLDNLSLSGSPTAVDRRELPGIGTVLRGRFGGKLTLCGVGSFAVMDQSVMGSSPDADLSKATLGTSYEQCCNPQLVAKYT